MAPRDTFIGWLRDAHALENTVIQTLEQHADAAKDHPELFARMREHLQEIRRHADLVEGCLKRYGESTSGLKEAMGAISGFVQGIAPSAAGDTLVKSAISDYAAEHFEIASYRSLRSAAKSLGDDETARICEEIIKEEERMAHWLEQQIPAITELHLGEKARQRGQ
jgi:ferritin-like metal-binding protein YciE